MFSRQCVLFCITFFAACAGAPSIHDSLTRSSLFTRVEGNGNPVVLIGGGGMDMRQWDHVAQDLSRDHQVIRFDHRGWGRSSVPLVPFSRTDDLLEILDHAGVKRAVLVGNSFGGGLAIDFVLARPDRVGGLIVVGSELGGFIWSEAFLQRGARFAAADSTERLELLLDDPYFIPGARTNPNLRRRAGGLLRENLGKVFALNVQLVHSSTVPAIRRLEEIQAPMLVVVPELDHPDLFEIADTLAKRVQRSERLVISGVGHLPHMEQPQQFSSLVRQFVARVNRGRPSGSH